MSEKASRKEESSSPPPVLEMAGPQPTPEVNCPGGGSANASPAAPGGAAAGQPRFHQLSTFSIISRPLTAQINFDDACIVLHCRQTTFGQYRTLMQHGNFAAELFDKSHVVFNHYQRMFACQGFE